MPAGDLFGAAVLTGVFLALLAAAELWRRLGSPAPESTRKLVHLGGGLVCLLFPFLVTSPWVVLALTAAMSGLFAGAARLGLLRSLHGVERSSRGAEYYPLAIFLVFVLTTGRPWLYLAAVLVLAVGDAFAALIGSRYGRIKYEVESDRKSLEGSLVFLVISFLAIHLPVLLLSDLSRLTCVLAALLVAVLVTGFEAVSLRGADNLFVPLAVVFILGKITTKPVPEILFQIVSLAALGVLIALLVRRAPLFNAGAVIAVILYTYANWSLASWQWALPVVAGLVCYLAGWAWVARTATVARVRVRAVVRALLPLLLILIAANSTDSFRRLFGPYLAASAAVLAFSLAGPVLHLAKRSGARRAVALVWLAVVAVAATGLLPWLLHEGRALSQLPVNAALVLAATWIVTLLDARAKAPPVGTWTAGRFLLTWVVAGAVLVLQVTGLVPAWGPG